VAAPGGQFDSGEVTVAVFATVPSGLMSSGGNGCGATTTTSTVTDPPAGMSFRSHSTVTASTDAQPTLSADTKRTPAGSVSVTFTSVAVDTPVFVTT
jgi:hypothetical protein